MDERHVTPQRRKLDHRVERLRPTKHLGRLFNGGHHGLGHRPHRAVTLGLVARVEDVDAAEDDGMAAILAASGAEALGDDGQALSEGM